MSTPARKSSVPLTGASSTGSTMTTTPPLSRRTSNSRDDVVESAGTPKSQHSRKLTSTEQSKLISRLYTPNTPKSTSKIPVGRTASISGIPQRSTTMQNGGGAKKALPMSPNVNNVTAKDALTSSSPLPTSNYTHMRTGSSIGLPSPTPINVASRGISTGRSPLPNTAGSKIPVLSSADSTSQRALFGTRNTSSPSLNSLPRVLSPTHSKARSISANPLSQSTISARDSHSNDNDDKLTGPVGSSSMLHSIDDEASRSAQSIADATNPLSTRSERELPAIVETTSTHASAAAYLPATDTAQAAEPLSPTEAELEPLSPRTRALRVQTAQQRKQSLSSNSNAADPDLLFPTKIAFMRTSPKKPVPAEEEEPLSPKSPPRSTSISKGQHHMRTASALPINQAFALPALHDDQLDDFDVDLTLDSPIKPTAAPINHVESAAEAEVEAPVAAEVVQPSEHAQKSEQIHTVTVSEPVAAVQHDAHTSSRRPSDVDTFGNVWPASTPTFSNDKPHTEDAAVAASSADQVPLEEQPETRQPTQAPVEETQQETHSIAHSRQPSDLPQPEAAPTTATTDFGLLSSDDEADDSLDISLNSNKENEMVQSHDGLNLDSPIGLDSTIPSPVPEAASVQLFTDTPEHHELDQHHTEPTTQQKETAAAVEQLQQMAATVEPIGTSAAVHDEPHAATASISAVQHQLAQVETEAHNNVAPAPEHTPADPQPTARKNVRQDSIDLGFDDDEELDGLMQAGGNKSRQLSLDIDEPAGEINSTQTQQQQAFADVQVKLRAMEAQRRATTQQIDNQKVEAVKEAEKLTQPDPQLVNEQQQLKTLAAETESLRRMSTIDTTRHATELAQSSNMQMEYCIAGLQFDKIPFNRGGARPTTVKLIQAADNQWYVSWLSKRKKPEQAQILLNNATLALNQAGGIFKHPKQGLKWRAQFTGDAVSRSFSIVTAERSLDLVAEKSVDYDAFVSVIRRLPIKSIVEGKR